MVRPGPCHAVRSWRLARVAWTAGLGAKARLRVFCANLAGLRVGTRQLPFGDAARPAGMSLGHLCVGLSWWCARLALRGRSLPVLRQSISSRAVARNIGGIFWLRIAQRTCRARAPDCRAGCTHDAPEAPRHAAGRQHAARDATREGWLAPSAFAGQLGDRARRAGQDGPRLLATASACGRGRSRGAGEGGLTAIARGKGVGARRMRTAARWSQIQCGRHDPRPLLCRTEPASARRASARDGQLSRPRRRPRIGLQRLGLHASGALLVAPLRLRGLS